MAQKAGPLRSCIFACTNKSQEECLGRMLFGTSRVYGAAAMRVRKGDPLFLLNLDTDLLYGVFKATTDGKFKLELDAWKGNYPYQVKVDPIGDIIPLTNGKKLLQKLGIGRSSPIGGTATQKLLELYGYTNIRDKDLSKYLFKGKVRIRDPIQWELPKKFKITNGFYEKIPQLEATNLWDFARQSYGITPKGDNKYPGVTPAELIWNLVWRYTEPNDLVVDPMCGSGTTLDVCKEEGRRAICYDISPPPHRQDIIQNDARKIPLDTSSVDLVFVDSPYGDNIRYNEHPDCIGKISSETETFYDELEIVISECSRILREGKVLGWLIGDQWVKGKFTPVGFKLYQRLSKHFDTVDIVCVTRRGQASHTSFWTNRARRLNFYLRGYKYLFIMRKPLPGKQKKERSRKVNWTLYERKKNGGSKTVNSRPA
jgi:SAM-dependent methyltransferase